MSQPRPALALENLLSKDRVPPQSMDAERAVLSACMQSAEALAESMQFLVPEDFYSPRHRDVYAALIALSERSEPADLVTVATELDRAGALEKMGGPAELDLIFDAGSSPANVAYHARIVQERSLLRRLIAISQRVAGDAFEGSSTAQGLLDAAQNELFQLSREAEQRGFVALKELANLTFQHIQEAYERGDEMTGLRTGLTDLDKLTGGLQPADLLILAGRPSMGKTALALNMAYHIAHHDQVPVGFFSLEMNAEQLVTRLISMESGFDSHSIRTGKLKPSDWPRLTQALGEITRTPIFVDDTSAISILELRSKARRMVQAHGVKLIMLDYLQLVSTHTRAENRQQEISLISRALKAMAKDLNVPVMALSQLSRAVETRDKLHRPVLSDLRESGAITGTLRSLAMAFNARLISEISCWRFSARVWVLTSCR